MTTLSGKEAGGWNNGRGASVGCGMKVMVTFQTWFFMRN